ncbi:hypothetical protein [Caloramator sp. mosi_1]|uniref:hypothetical protein n=1 Tax=Caloramator sp. mosi_1 TaxID=3023090 RepID=UPI003081B3A4
MDEDQIIVVQETEYTGAGKHHMAQLSFAKENGIEVKFGNPEEERAGCNIILPEHPSLIKARDVDLNKLKKSYIKNCIDNYKVDEVSRKDVEFLAEDTKLSIEEVEKVLSEINVSIV